MVVVFGTDMASVPVAGVRGVPLSSDDPLRKEWVVVVVGAHYAGALVAHDLGDLGPDRNRRFEFVLTHHLDTVLAVARSLLGRVVTASEFPAP